MSNISAIRSLADKGYTCSTILSVAYDAAVAEGGEWNISVSVEGGESNLNNLSKDKAFAMGAYILQNNKDITDIRIYKDRHNGW